MGSIASPDSVDTVKGQEIIRARAAEPSAWLSSQRALNKALSGGGAGDGSPRGHPTGGLGLG